MSRCYSTALLGYSIPLVFIGAAALLSGWFDVFNNALSDLGHATRSNVSVLFNLGLSLGSFFIMLFASLYSVRFNVVITALLLFTGFSLNLVAVFDEVYGYVHFAVSVIFFISVAFLLVGYSVIFRKYVVPLSLLAVGIASWYIHFTYDIPRGVAIPELVSVFAVLPVYVDYMRRVCSKCCVG